MESSQAETVQSAMVAQADTAAGNESISYYGSIDSADFAELIDIVSLNEGQFSMTVITVDASYVFHFEPSEVFDYIIISEFEYEVSYNNSQEIFNFLNIIFADQEVVEIEFF